MTDPTPTGTVTWIDGRHVLVQTREFHAPVEDVWAALTDSDRLARWIGTWSGDPASGAVDFQMTFEEGAPGEVMQIRTCEPPYRLHLTSRSEGAVWLLDVDLTHADGVTTLTLTQPGVSVEEAAGVGPGWEYYLDRMVDAETGEDPARRVFEPTYYPGMSEHFTAQFRA